MFYQRTNWIRIVFLSFRKSTLLLQCAGHLGLTIDASCYTAANAVDYCMLNYIPLHTDHLLLFCFLRGEAGTPKESKTLSDTSFDHAGGRPDPNQAPCSQ